MLVKVFGGVVQVQVGGFVEIKVIKCFVVGEVECELVFLCVVVFGLDVFVGDFVFVVCSLYFCDGGVVGYGFDDFGFF